MIDDKKYYFCNEEKSFFIKEPHKRKPWVNQLWNSDGYVATISQVGDGFSRYINDEAYQTFITSPEGKKYIYLRDDDKQKCWNIGVAPLLEPVENYKCEHSMAYTSISSDYDGISGKVTYFVPQHGTCEIWKLEIKNKRDKKARLSIFPLVSFDLGGYAQPAYYTPFNCSETLFDSKLNGIFAWNKDPYNPHAKYNAFLCSSEKVSGYDGNLSEFFGELGSFSRPEALLNGKDCSDSRATVLALGAVLQNKIEVEPNDVKCLYFILGASDSIDDSIEIKENMFKNTEKLLNDVKENIPKKYENLWAKTPEKRINNILNHWVQKQVDFCSIGKKAVRDNAQIAMALLNYEPQKAKETMKECFMHQYKDGHAALNWSPELDLKYYSDPHMWLILATCEVIKETGDFEFLKGVVPYQNGGSGSIFEHMKKAIEYLTTELGPHGLPLIHYADWNDALNIDDENAESIFVAMGLVWALSEMISLCEYIGEKDYSEKLQEQKEKFIKIINDTAWDGKWYVRAFSCHGTVGSKSSETGGNIYVNPQTWSILSDVVPKNRLKDVLDSIDSMDTEYGIPLCSPSYKKYDPHVGRMSGMLPGLFENGGIYNHCSGFKVMADCKLKRGNKALETMLKVIPDNDNNPCEINGTEPYLFVNCYCMHPAFYTRVWFSWLTGTSAWMLRDFYEGILGLKRDYSGLKIDPCFPDSWNEAEAFRCFRGTKYHITYRRLGNSMDKISINFDGKTMNGNVLPIINDNKIHEVDVTFV